MIKVDDMEKLPKYIQRAKDYDRFRAIKRKGDMAKTNAAFWRLSQKYRAWETCPCCGDALLYADNGIKDYVCLHCDKEFTRDEFQTIIYERQKKPFNIRWDEVWEDIVRNSWSN